MKCHCVYNNFALHLF